MDRTMLRDDQWARIEQLLPGKKSDPGCTAKDNRRFVEAVLWIMRTGSPWRDLPKELGHWHRTYVRFSRWREKGIWERMATALQGDADMEHLWGTGDPGYKIKAEFNDRKHERGVISMARSQHPDSAGCQFFICHGAAPFLDGQYTCFGKVIKGDEVLEAIATSPVKASASGEPSKPVNRMGVVSVKIVSAEEA